MLKKLFSVYDVKTGSYGSVMVLLSVGEALRVMQDTVNANDNIIAKHPADFRLDCLGEIDMVTGKIESTTPQHIVDIAQLIVEAKGVK